MKHSELKQIIREEIQKEINPSNPRELTYKGREIKRAAMAIVNITNPLLYLKESSLNNDMFPQETISQVDQLLLVLEKDFNQLSNDFKAIEKKDIGIYPRFK